jgi:carbon-monoxide dehydrogenase large subunit
VGASERKHNGDIFLRGEMEYIDDLRLPDMVHAAVLRSPYAHARIRGVDLSRVRDSGSVMLAISGAEAAEHTDPIPYFASPATFGGKVADVRCLAVDKVVYAGEPVAAVVASSRAEAEAALELIEVDYEPLGFVIDTEAALAPDAPRIYEDWADNVVITVPFKAGDVETAMKDAVHVIEDEIRIQRYSTQPLEPRGYIGEWNKRKRDYTFYGSVQNPHPLRWVLAQALRVSESDVRVIAPTVGGAFGLKMHGHPEESLVCLLSRLCGRPVKWIEDRSETLLVGAREQHHRFKVAVDATGVITGLQNRFTANVGALGAPPGWSMAFLSGLSFPTGYRVRNTDVVGTVVATNKAPWNAARGYGKESTNLVMERIMDMIALKLDLDPLEVRRRNFIRPDEFPYRTPSGLNIDSGDYHEAVNKAAALMGIEDLRKQQMEALQAGRYLGIGFAFELTPESGDIPGTLVSGFDTSTVKMSPDGKVSILTGVTSPGSGNDTSIIQIVAESLGLPMSSCSIIQGDTALTPYGFGNYSGRSMVTGGNAAFLAAQDVRGKLLQVAARILQTTPDDVELADNVASSATDPGKQVPIPSVAYTIYTLAFAVATGVEPPLESSRVYLPDNIQQTPDPETGTINIYPTYSNAVHAALVDVDPETGKVDVLRFGVVHDPGTVINPRFVEGQMEGAVAMGIGAGLMEHSAYDPETGRLLADRFKTYLMPRASDLPSIEQVHQETPSPYTVLGTKGAGEAGVGGAQAAIANAVHNALAPLGVVVREMPLTPRNVLHAIVSAGKDGQA